MNVIPLAPTLAASLLLAACASPGPSLNDAVASTTWTLTGLGRVDIDPDRPPTLRFDADARASGFAGVNQYSVAPTIGPGDTLTFAPVAATKMAGPPERMRLEAAFFDALALTRRATVSGDTLSFWDADNELVARFTR